MRFVSSTVRRGARRASRPSDVGADALTDDTFASPSRFDAERSPG